MWKITRHGVYLVHDTAFPLDIDSLATLHCSNAKMRFQSFFMLITVQPFFFASAISASVNVPTCVGSLARSVGVLALVVVVHAPASSAARRRPPACTPSICLSPIGVAERGVPGGARSSGGMPSGLPALSSFSRSLASLVRDRLAALIVAKVRCPCAADDLLGRDAVRLLRVHRARSPGRRR